RARGARAPCRRARGGSLDVVAATGGAGFLIIIGAIFAVMWLFVIRPQKRRQVAQKSLLENVSEGDEILTAGGLYGTVRSIEGDEVILEVAPGTNVRLARRAVAAILTENEEPEEVEDPDQIVVQLPGVHDPERAAQIIGKTAQLELYDLEKNLTGPSVVAQGIARYPRALTSPYPLLAGQQLKAKTGSPTAFYLFNPKK